MMPEPEYLVLWNGVNDGHDHDLLDWHVRIPEKRIAAPVESVHDRVLVKAALDQYPQSTLQQLVAVTKLSHASVYDQLYLLRIKGQLGEQDTGRRLSGGRIERVYWLRQSVSQ